MRNNVGECGPTDEGPVTFEEMQIGSKVAGGELVIVHQVVVLHVKVLRVAEESCGKRFGYGK